MLSEINKEIYFTVETASLDASISHINVTSEDGTIPSWCKFDRFEQVTDDEWRIVFVITERYMRSSSEPEARYAYVSGVLYDDFGGICHKINLSDGLKIKQEGCLSEGIVQVTSEAFEISQGCGFLEFLNTISIATVICSDTNVELVTNSELNITQECQFAYTNISGNTEIDCTM